LNTATATTLDLAGDPTVIARAEAVRPHVAAASNDIETKRRLPPALLDTLHEAQLFRLLLPRSSRGIETDPVTFFHVIETIAKADASTAWCLSQAGGCAMSAAYLDLPVAQAIFGDPRAVLAWGPGPKVRAVECEGGYRVTGVWAFASGGRHATWLGAHCPIYAADGSPRHEANGAPLDAEMPTFESDNDALAGEHAESSLELAESDLLGDEAPAEPTPNALGEDFAIGHHGAETTPQPTADTTESGVAADGDALALGGDDAPLDFSDTDDLLELAEDPEADHASGHAPMNEDELLDLLGDPKAQPRDPHASPTDRSANH